MDKQSSKKPFFIMPEWAWAIVVGMFMLLLFLNHVIPGHAANLYPLTPEHLGYGANYVSHITVKGGELYVGGTYIANVGLILQESEERIARFEADADAALTSLFSQIPKDQTYFALADDSAYGSVLVWLRSFLDDRDIQYSEIIIDYEDPFWYPQQWPDNWRDAYSESIYSLGPYSVYVYVRNTLLAPSPTPLPPQEQFVDLYVGAPWFTSEPYFSQVGYYWITFATNDFDLVLPNSTNAFGLAYSNYNVFNPWKRSVIFSLSRGSDFLFYIYSDSISDIRIYFTGSAHYSDLSFVKDNFSFVSFTGNNGWNFRSSSYSGLTGFQLLSDSGSILSSSLPVHDLGTISSWSNDSSAFNFDLNATSVNNPYVQALRFGLDGAHVPEPTQDPNQPSPSPTQAPLPTSGESVHVILPTGTPSPTPPFSVPGGSNGEPGSGSPGSVGSGLSASQSSGILSYFSSFLSNNPALAFIAACFPAIPSEILYPLFILLFILMILAAIRLFVHFAGG